MLRGVFLARLFDQPLSYQYPSALLQLAKSKNIFSIKRWIQARMIGHPSCRVYQDLWWEFQGALGDHKAILRSPNPPLIYRLATRRHYPMCYHDDTAYFMECDIAVKAPILIPRSDTEAWLLNLVPSIREGGLTSILDVGFGSGCISLGLARILGPTANVTGIDRSGKAYSLAQSNRQALSLNNVKFKLCNLMDYEGNHQVVIANPPYIRHCDRAVKVSPSTRRWESALALHPPRLGPDDGAYYHKMLIDRVHSGAIQGCKVLALELDGTKRQYDIVHSHAKTKVPSATVQPVSDGRRKYRAIKIGFY